MSEPRPYAELNPIDAIKAEREYQEAKWGDANHDRELSFAEWALILSREVGETMEAAGECYWPQDRRPEVHYIDKLSNLRSELVQVAAVAVAMIEVVDATSITPPKHDIDI